MSSGGARLLLVTSSPLEAEVAASGLRAMGFQVDVMELRGLLFTPPDELWRALSGQAARYDHVIVPGTYPWDLSEYGRKVLKGPEGLGLLVDVIKGYGIDVLSPSQPFEKANPELLQEIAQRKLREMKSGLTGIPATPPPITVISEVPVKRGIAEEELEAVIASLVADGADYVVLAPLDKEGGWLRTLVGDLRASFPRLRLGLDARPETLRASVDAYDLLLSVMASEAARDLSWASSKEVVVLIYDDDIPRLEDVLREAKKSGARPVLDPVALPTPRPGLLGTLLRLQSIKPYAAPKMIGLSNVVELMDADTSGTAALLTSLASEAGVSAVMVEEASAKARGLTFEARIASDMASLALAWGKAAKDVSLALLNSKLKHYITEVNGVRVDMTRRKEVEVNVLGASLRLRCDDECPVTELARVASGPQLVIASILTYRACLPWSSTWSCLKGVTQQAR